MLNKDSRNQYQASITKSRASDSLEKSAQSPIHQRKKSLGHEENFVNYNRKSNLKSVASKIKSRRHESTPIANMDDSFHGSDFIRQLKNQINKEDGKMDT